MNSKLHILQHSLGVNEYGEGRQFRNHFVTGPDSSDFDDCVALVAEGLMKDRGASVLTGGDSCFVVTPQGVDYVALNSPAAPTPPKRTRGQRRYMAYLAAECGESFGEWLKNPYWNDQRARHGA